MTALEVYKEMLQDPSIDDYTRVLEILLQDLFAERGCLWLDRENKFIYRGDEELREKFPFSRQVVDSVLEEGRAFLCLDSREDFRVTRFGSIAVNNVRSVVCAAARDSEGKVLALAYFDNRGTTGGFRKEDLNLLKSVMQCIPGAVPEPEELDAPPIPQAGVLAWLGGKLVLVTSRSGKRWVIPKGHVEASDQLVSTRAAIEAYEEAGLRGKVSEKAVGDFYYTKRGRRYRVMVYDMTSCTLEDDWPEAKQRIRKLYTPQEAAELVDEAGLASLILRPR